MSLNEEEVIVLYHLMTSKAKGEPTKSAPEIPIDWVQKGGKNIPPKNGLMMFSTKSIAVNPPELELLLSAVHFACLVVEKFCVDGGIYLPALDSSIKAVDRLLVIWWKHGGIAGEGVYSGYDCLAESSDELLRLVRTDGRAAKEILSRLGRNMILGAQMPERVRILLGAVLAGDIVPAVPPAREPTQQYRDTLLVALADGIRDRTIYSGGATQTAIQRGKPARICGCTIAAAALTAFGIPVDAVRARKIYTEKSRLPLEQLNLRSLFELPSLAGRTLLEREPADVSQNVFKALKTLKQPI